MHSQNLMDLLHPESEPDRLAVVDGHVRLSRGELLDLAQQRAEVIRQRVPLDCRVGLKDSQDHQSIVSVLAALLAERSIVMLPAEGEDARVRAAAAARCALILDGDSTIEPTWDLSRDPWAYPHVAVEQFGSSEAVVLYTSGTTSEPRGVRISRRNLATNLTAMLRATPGWSRSDRFGLVLAQTHSFGLSMILMSLARHCPVVILQGGLPSRAVTEAVERLEVSVLGCVPYYLRLLRRRGLEIGTNFAPALRTLFMAGGGITDDERGALLEHYRGETFLMYGFTESTARVAVRRDGDGAPANSVGLPLPGTCVEIVSDLGDVVPVGEVGRIRVKAPSLMLGYLGEPPRIPGDPWTTTDLGRMDECGNLFVTGRQAEMLNFRGNRVSAVAVEAVVTGINGIHDARLIPDARDEDAQCALHVIADGNSEHGELRREILRVVTPRGLVREVVFVDHLEFTRSGKPLRRV